MVGATRHESYISQPKVDAPLLAVGTSSGFVLAVCGSNALTPLVPHYQDEYGFGAAESAAIFSMYFIALMGVLLLSARTPLVRHARKCLPLAVAIGVFADVLLIAGDHIPWLLYAGRLLSGTCVAMATGAAAAVMVGIRGERGRAFIGTGSLLGAGGGLAAAILIVAFLPAPAFTVYGLHIVALVVCLLVLVIGLRRAPQVLAVAAHQVIAAPVAKVRSPRRPSVGAHALGGLAWAVGALAVGVLPAALLDRGVTDSLLVALILSGSCLFASTLAGLAGFGTRRFTSAVGAIVMLGLGWGVAVGGLALGWWAAVLAGCIAAGLGQAAGYRVGLSRLTTGLHPVRQGQVSSGYSAASYAAAGTFVLGTGGMVSLLGTALGMLMSNMVFALCCVAAGITIANTADSATSPEARHVQRTADPRAEGEDRTRDPLSSGDAGAVRGASF